MKHTILKNTTADTKHIADVFNTTEENVTKAMFYHDSKNLFWERMRMYARDRMGAVDVDDSAPKSKLGMFICAITAYAEYNIHKLRHLLNTQNANNR